MPDVQVLERVRDAELTQSIAPIITFPPSNLPTEDGEPMDTPWHRDEIALLIDVYRQARGSDRSYYCGGNMFIYYSSRQADAALRREFEYRGPDFFIVLDVDGARERETWKVWEEEGRYPNVIIELLSPSTAKEDLTTKRRLYERTFRTPEYFCYDPSNQELLGWRINQDRYEPIMPDRRGYLWSDQLNLWLGRWNGEFLANRAVWLRFFQPDGSLVLTYAEAERRRAETESRRAEQLQQELADLQAKLRAAGIDPGV